MIGIIIAMEKELLPYLRYPYRAVRKGGREVYETEINGVRTAIVLSGVGKVNAAYAATLLITHYRPSLLISTGVSGGLGVSNLLDVVVATATVQHDFDTTPLGDSLGFVSTVNQTYFYTSPEHSKPMAERLSAKMGILAAGDQFIADCERAKEIVAQFDAIACDMESGAIGQVAYAENLPYIAVRCISDGAGADAGLSFMELCERAAGILSDAVIDTLPLLESIQRTEL